MKGRLLGGTGKRMVAGDRSVDGEVVCRTSGRESGSGNGNR